MTAPDIAAAARFLAANGRVLDRRRFERLFEGGGPEPVTAAVAAYRNDDGGFGHALEPDGRTPHSQPAAVELALRTLHQADAWDDTLVAGACGWLERTAPAEGGAVFVAPSVEGWPHAPWWQPQEGLPASLLTTGLIAGTLHARGVEHPWLDQATAWLWSRIDGAGLRGPNAVAGLRGPNAVAADVDAYEMRGVLAFLDYVPDRERAEKVFLAVGDRLMRSGLVTVDPDAPGEVHGPLDFAPRPGCLARALFDDRTMTAHLDHLAAGQRDDGGWTFNWLAWSPVAELEWRGSLTVDALDVLRANSSGPFAPVR